MLYSTVDDGHENRQEAGHQNAAGWIGRFRQRRHAVTVLRRPSLRSGEHLVGALVTDHFGRTHRFDDLTDGRPLLLLVCPAHGGVTGDARFGHGVEAIRALDSARASAASLGIDLAVLTPEPVAHLVGRDGGRLAPMPLLLDPDAELCEAAGLGVGLTSDGRRTPELALVVLGADGVVVDVLREQEPQVLIRSGLALATRIAAASRRRAA